MAFDLLIFFRWLEINVSNCLSKFHFRNIHNQKFDGAWIRKKDKIMFKGKSEDILDAFNKQEIRYLSFPFLFFFYSMKLIVVVY